MKADRPSNLSMGAFKKGLISLQLVGESQAEALQWAHPNDL